MNEKPILFSAPMVRAVLAGNKTQTRRAMNPQPSEDWCPHAFGEIHKMASYGFKMRNGAPIVIGFGITNRDGDEAYVSKYGNVGDRLWVKETHALNPYVSGEYIYRATEPDVSRYITSQNKWKPSIFCTRKASRITLEIVSVRVERLNDISESDATSEGVSGNVIGNKEAAEGHGWPWPFTNFGSPAKMRYSLLWESINGKGSWVKNPFVWVLEFKEVKP